MSTAVETVPTPRGKAARVSPNLWTIVPFAVFLAFYVALPRIAKETQLTMLIYIGINALLALGLNLLMGYAGQISLGHAAFFGMGAYVSAILTVRPIPQEVIPGFSAGVGIMAGTAAAISLTRATGWKLVAVVAGLLVCSWIAGFALAGWPVAVLIYGAGMAGIGAAVGTGWARSAAAGIAAVVVRQSTDFFLGRVLQMGGTSPWVAMVVGVLFTGLVAYLIGGQVLRLRGHYLAMATLGFGIIVEIVFRQWTAVTGGSSDGIYGIPGIDLPGWIQRPFGLLSGGDGDPQKQYYYLVWAFVFVALVLAVNIVRSRVGRAFRAVHGSELAAESLGVDTERYKVQVFVLSAALASVAGSLHAHNAGIGYINPGEFSFMFSVQLVVMVVIGGMASVWGALFGAAAIQVLKTWLLTIEKTDVHLLGFTLTGLEPIVFGALLIIVMMALPQGLVRGSTDAVAAGLRAFAKARTRRSE